MRRGFTLIEIVIVIAIMGVLAAIVTVSVVGVRQRERNAQRATDISVILSAVYQYALDTGSIPASVTSATTTICRTGAASCAGLADLSVLTNSQKYLTSLPVDPQATSTNATGYTIVVNANKRVTVAAPSAEASTTVSITR